MHVSFRALFVFLVQCEECFVTTRNSPSLFCVYSINCPTRAGQMWKVVEKTFTYVCVSVCVCVVLVNICKLFLPFLVVFIVALTQTVLSFLLCKYIYRERERPQSWKKKLLECVFSVVTDILTWYYSIHDVSSLHRCIVYSCVQVTCVVSQKRQYPD